jgi:hypothetical protein
MPTCLPPPIPPIHTHPPGAAEPGHGEPAGPSAEHLRVVPGRAGAHPVSGLLPPALTAHPGEHLVAAGVAEKLLLQWGRKGG